MSVMVTTMSGHVACGRGEGREGDIATSPRLLRDLNVEDESQRGQHREHPGGGQGVALQIPSDVESD
jgi:hypothetical protein